MKDLLEYGLVRALEGTVGALPEAGARAAGEVLGRLARRPLGIRREAVERHLARAFPDRGEAWADAVSRRCYRHFGREAGALARAGRLDPAGLVAATAGTDRVRRVLEGVTGGTARAAGHDAADGAEGPGRPSGALVVTGHLGNWELAGAVLAGLGFGVSAVVRRQANRRVHRRLERLRRGLGVEPVPMAAAGRRIPAALSEGRVVALVADQDAGRKGVFVPFLGRPASTFRGPARLALEHRVPLVFGALVREAGRYRALARPVWSPGGGRTASGPGQGLADPDAPGRGPPGEKELTRAWAAELERAVRERPGQYFWFHRRWKTRPGPDRDRS